VSQLKQGWRWLVWTAGGLLLAALLATGGYYLLQELHPAEVSAGEVGGEPEQSGPVHVEIIHPEKGKMDRSTTQPGSVQAFESARLFAEVSGYLKAQTVDIGDRVKKGQVLIQVDVPELEQQVERHKAGVQRAEAQVLQMKAHVATATAELEAANGEVTYAEANVKSKAAALRFREKQLQRMRELFALKSIDERLVDEKQEQRDAALEAKNAAEAGVLMSKAKVVAAKAKIQQAEADVKEAEAQVKLAQSDLARAQVMVNFATITSPYDGVITQRSKFRGDFVRSASEGGGQTPLLTVEQIDKLRMVVLVPDQDVPFVDVGDPAKVQIDALPGKVFTGTVSRNAQSEDPQTRLMRVEIDLPNPKGKILPGMYGRVTILLDHSDLLSIPTSCLVGPLEKGKGKVYVVREGRARLVPVRLGTENGQRVAIVAGLSAHDDVVLHPGSGLADGTPVAVAPPRRGRS
jgi:RND family efflux transporter MFP subunit